MNLAVGGKHRGADPEAAVGGIGVLRRRAGALLELGKYGLGNHHGHRGFAPPLYRAHPAASAKARLLRRKYNERFGACPRLPRRRDGRQKRQGEPTLTAWWWALLAPKFIVVYVVAASALYVHFRGRDRHTLIRQLKDHSTLMAPYNALMYLFSAVPAGPFVDVGRLPELARLRDNWQVMRDEALALTGEGQIRAATGHNDLGFNSFFKEGWKRFYLKWYGAP